MLLPTVPNAGDEGGPVAHAPIQSGPARGLAGINHVLVGDFVLGRTSLRYASLVSLVLATLIGLATYVTEGWFRDGEVSLRPDLVSTLAALMLVSALYARRLIEWALSVYSLLSLVLNVTITAILVQALLGGSGWSFLGLSMPYLVAFAIVLTWTGMRPLAPVVWFLVVVVGLANLQTVSDAMGLWGYLFIILAAVGVFLQVQLNPKRFLPELQHEFKGDALIPPAPSIRQANEAGKD